MEHEFPGNWVTYYHLNLLITAAETPGMKNTYFCVTQHLENSTARCKWVKTSRVLRQATILAILLRSWNAYLPSHMRLEYVLARYALRMGIANIVPLLLVLSRGALLGTINFRNPHLRVTSLVRNGSRVSALGFALIVLRIRYPVISENDPSDYAAVSPLPTSWHFAAGRASLISSSGFYIMFWK